MKRLAFFLLFPCLLGISLPIFDVPVFGDMSDCLWGGKNEETSYSPSYMPRKENIALTQYQAPMNLGAPQPAAIPIQPTPNAQSVSVPQTNIPTITIPAGPVGSVGQPATPQGAIQYATALQTQLGAEIVYILPSSLHPETEICVDGAKTIPAMEVKVVSAYTPGAIPVALKTVTVRRPKVEYHWTYAPIVQKTEALVQVIDPRSGRVVRTYCQEDEDQSMLPWLHRREVITYEMVEAKIAVPILLAPSVSSATNTLIQSGLP